MRTNGWPPSSRGEKSGLRPRKTGARMLTWSRLAALRASGWSAAWKMAGVIFSMDADSPLVKGLAALLCELYDGATAADIAAFASEIVPALGLDRQISPTRLHGPRASVEQTDPRFRRSQQLVA